MTVIRSSARSVAVGMSLLALAACGGADKNSAPPPPADEPPARDAPLSGAAPSESPAASIIRPDVAPDPVIELPPEPLTLTIGFPEGFALTAEAERQLSAVVDSEALAHGWPVVLRGHSDSGGSDAANLRASRRRAEAVAAWLTKQGVSEDRIRIVAFGEQNPIAPNAARDGSPDETGRARNRRVEVIVSPDGRTKKELQGATSTQELAKPGTAVEKIVNRLSDADTP